MDELEKYYEDYRKYLLNESQRLYSYIHVFKHLHKKKEDRLDELNLFPAFIHVTTDALFSVIILWVDKLFSKKSERGFVNYLAFIENSLKLFEIAELKRRRKYPDGHWMLDRAPITHADIKKHRGDIDSIEALPHFKLRRDKFHAHFDKEYFFDREKIDQDAPIKWGDIDSVVEIMKDIINTYSASYDGNLYELELYNIFDIDYVLDILHKHNQELNS